MQAELARVLRAGRGRLRRRRERRLPGAHRRPARRAGGPGRTPSSRTRDKRGQSSATPRSTASRTSPCSSSPSPTARGSGPFASREDEPGRASRTRPGPQARGTTLACERPPSTRPRRRAAPPERDEARRRGRRAARAGRHAPQPGGARARARLSSSTGTRSASSSSSRAGLRGDAASSTTRRATTGTSTRSRIRRGPGRPPPGRRPSWPRARLSSRCRHRRRRRRRATARQRATRARAGSADAAHRPAYAKRAERIRPGYDPVPMSAGTTLIGLDDVLAAREAIGTRLHRTPMFSSRQLGERIGGSVHLKAELFQRTGSFKIRGVLAKLATLTAGGEGPRRDRHLRRQPRAGARLRGRARGDPEPGRHVAERERPEDRGDAGVRRAGRPRARQIPARRSTGSTS